MRIVYSLWNATRGKEAVHECINNKDKVLYFGIRKLCARNQADADNSNVCLSRHHNFDDARGGSPKLANTYSSDDGTSRRTNVVQLLDIPTRNE